MRLSEDQILLRLMRYDAMPKRALLTEVYGAWRALGLRARRGQTLPPLRFAKQMIEEVHEFVENKSGHPKSEF